jgi:hypothetical protein
MIILRGERTTRNGDPKEQSREQYRQSSTRQRSRPFEPLEDTDFRLPRFQY